MSDKTFSDEKYEKLRNFDYAIYWQLHKDDIPTKLLDIIYRVYKEHGVYGLVIYNNLKELKLNEDIDLDEEVYKKLACNFKSRLANINGIDEEAEMLLRELTILSYEYEHEEDEDDIYNTYVLFLNGLMETYARLRIIQFLIM